MGAQPGSGSKRKAAVDADAFPGKRRAAAVAVAEEAPDWSKVRKRISAQDSEVVVPRLRGMESELKKLELPNLFSLAKPSPLGVRTVLTG